MTTFQFPETQPLTLIDNQNPVTPAMEKNTVSILETCLIDQTIPWVKEKELSATSPTLTMEHTTLTTRTVTPLLTNSDTQTLIQMTQTQLTMDPSEQHRTSVMIAKVPTSSTSSQTTMTTIQSATPTTLLAGTGSQLGSTQATRATDTWVQDLATPVKIHSTLTTKDKQYEATERRRSWVSAQSMASRFNFCTIWVSCQYLMREITNSCKLELNA